MEVASARTTTFGVHKGLLVYANPQCRLSSYLEAPHASNALPPTIPTSTAQSPMEDVTAKTALLLPQLPQGQAAPAMAPPASSHQTGTAMPVQPTNSPLQLETATTDASA
jgi:hypothetical protein